MIVHMFVLLAIVGHVKDLSVNGNLACLNGKRGKLNVVKSHLNKHMHSKKATQIQITSHNNSSIHYTEHNPKAHSTTSNNASKHTRRMTAVFGHFYRFCCLYSIIFLNNYLSWDNVCVVFVSISCFMCCYDRSHSQKKIEAR